MVDKVIKEAARLMKENTKLKHYEAVIVAKKIIKEKEPTSSPAKIGS